MAITFTRKTWVDYQEGPYLEASELNRFESALDALVNGTSRAVRLDGDTMTGGLTLSAGNLNVGAGDIRTAGTSRISAAGAVTANSLSSTDQAGTGERLVSASAAGAQSATIAVSAFAKTLLDDADAAEVRATIGAAASLGFTPVNKAGDALNAVFTFANANGRPNTRFIDGGVGAPPAFEMFDSQLGADAKSWRVGLTSGSFTLSAATDDWGVVSDVFLVDRSGNTQINGSLRIYNAGAGAYQAVVGTRKPGWSAPSGTATRTTFATGSVTLEQLAERVKALIDDLTAHGLIGA